ncbi:MAG: histone deacetylase family protein, partial [Anaerolineales bacterium]|nr:histone deacetylase family protein [Anaerolineales bacterium]
MKVFYSPTHLQHNPPFEGYNAEGPLPCFEKPDRALVVLEALKKTDGVEILPPIGFGMAPILEVHRAPYLAYLESAYQDWASVSPVSGMAFIPGTFGIGPEVIAAGKVSAQTGFFCMDTTVGITAQTYQAALQSAFCALSGAQALSQGDSTALGLCRPPGHHAGQDICGGYCFLNNIAIAAQWLSHTAKVAILDIDYHAGNGTQQIFYTRSDVLTVSLHADPRDEYPYYCGYAHETGDGPGLGFHHNFPLPQGTDDSAYLLALDPALDIIRRYAPQYLLVSAGMDLYKDDPQDGFMLTTSGIHAIA